MTPDAVPGFSHLRHHLGLRLERDAQGRPAGAMPLFPQHRTRHGAVSAGVVATLADVASGQTAGDEGIGPAVTSHLALRMPPLGPCTRLRAQPSVARAGRSSVVNVVHVTDPDRDVTVAVATVTFAVLRGTGGSHGTGSSPGVPGVPSVWSEVEQVPIDATTDDLVGVRPRATSSYEMDLARHVRNVNGVLHGGALVLFAEHASLLAAEEAGLGRPVVDEIDVHFLAAVTTGPVVGTATVVGDGGHARLTVLIDAVDEGEGGRRVGVALVGVAAHDAAGGPGRRLQD
jgi:acyl-coenzyme A thioesterase PaaI-like protein